MYQAHESYKKGYESIVKLLKSEKAALDRAKQSGQFSNAYIKELADNLNSNIHKELESISNYVSERYQKNAEQIKAAHLKKYEHESDPNPTAELLKRQDIERKYKLMHTRQLEEAVNEFKETGEGNKLELELLRVELRGRGLKNVDGELSGFMEHHIDKGYLNDPSFAELNREMQYVRMFKTEEMLIDENGDSVKFKTNELIK